MLDDNLNLITLEYKGDRSLSYSLLTIEKRAKGVTWITINHPPVNTISDELMDELQHATDALEQDATVRVIVLTSSHPKVFLAGADLKGMMQSDTDDEAEDPIAAACAKMQYCFDRFSTIPKPVIAAINGHALGGGCELALACDFRFMSAGKIGLTELSLGIIPGAGGTQRMTHLLGRAKAMENIFLAEKLTAKEAEVQGLITKAVTNLEEETTAFAEQLAEGAVYAMGKAKQAINAAEMPLKEGLVEEAKAFSATFQSDEPSIGLAAFFQKETPQFYTGK